MWYLKPDSGTPGITGAISLTGFVVIFMLLTGCVSVDDYLEVDIDHTEPAVIFDADIRVSDEDTILLACLKDASVFKGMSYTSIVLYLKNTNGKIEVVNEQGKHSNFMRFTELYESDLSKVRRYFPRFKGMKIFIVYLKGMTVDADVLRKYRTLGNAHFRKISTRNSKLIRDRRIYYHTFTPDTDQKVFFRKVVPDIFRVKII